MKTSTIRKIPRSIFLRTLMNKTVQKMLLPFGRDLQPERWIFVIGCYNSGTTLLANILRKHYLIGGLPNEGAFLTDSLPYPELFGWPRMWCQCFNHIHLDPSRGGPEKAERIKRHWSLWFPKKTPNLIEKSISNSARVLFLQEYFQPAYFIYIIRNGYAVAKGIQKKANYKRWNCQYKDSGYPIELCAKQWQVSDEIIDRDRLELNHFLCVKYEELAENPSQTFRKITDFLKISPIQKEILRQNWSIHSTVSPIINMNSASLSQLSADEFKIIEKVAGRTLSKYSYTRHP